MSLSNQSGAWTATGTQKSFSSWSKHSEQGNRTVRLRGQTEMAEIKRDDRTTVILRNLPEGFSRDMVADLLRSQGLEKFDFIYLPVKFSLMVSIGYAFINFATPEAAQECISKLDGIPAQECISKLDGISGLAAPCEPCLNVYWSEK